MNPLALGDLVSIGSLAVAALALIVSMLKSHRADAAKDQMLKDRLETIYETTRDTRDTVRELNRKLDDHSVRLTRVEEQVGALSARLSRVESLTDSNFIGLSD